jgi:hypothetical protein
MENARTPAFSGRIAANDALQGHFVDNQLVKSQHATQQCISSHHCYVACMERPQRSVSGGLEPYWLAPEFGDFGNAFRHRGDLLELKTVQFV